MPTATDPSDLSGAGTTEKTSRPGVSPASAGLRWGTLAVLVAVLCASAGVLGWRLTRGDDHDSSLVSSRESAMALASRFMVTVNTYGPQMLGKDGKTMPSYRAAVEKMLTAKFTTQFEQGVVYAEATVAGNKIGRTAKVYQTGVAAIDDDTATVLVAGQISVTVPQKGTTKRTVAGRELFRVDVDLVKTHGAWKVDNWASAEPASTGTGSSGVAQ